jgi:hypothetical protein
MTDKEKKDHAKADATTKDRPYSPINKELIYMEKVETFMKR